MSKITIGYIGNDRQFIDKVVDCISGLPMELQCEPAQPRVPQRVTGGGADLILLDLDLDEKEHRMIWEGIRTAYNGPMLLLTEKVEEPDYIAALKAGAEQYLDKSGSQELLRLQLQLSLKHSLLRDKEMRKNQHCITVGELTVNGARREIYVRNSPVRLGVVEFDILLKLVQNAGRVVSRDDLFKAVFKTEYDGIDRAIDIYVCKLRQKLDDPPSSPRYIKTVRGEGYLLIN